MSFGRLVVSYKSVCSRAYTSREIRGASIPRYSLPSSRNLSINAMTKIGIFPASGGIGGSTVKHILNRIPTKDLTFVARSPERLEEQRLAGATVRKADYDDTASLEHAFDGVDVLFLISYASVEHLHRTEV
jgi:hypothetical protein